MSPTCRGSQHQMESAGAGWRRWRANRPCNRGLRPAGPFSNDAWNIILDDMHAMQGIIGRKDSGHPTSNVTLSDLERRETGRVRQGDSRTRSHVPRQAAAIRRERKVAGVRAELRVGSKGLGSLAGVLGRV
jgi:hypothetical protein